jgi:hypothetical protein
MARHPTGRHTLRTNAKVLPPAPWIPRTICGRLAALFAIDEMRDRWRRAVSAMSGRPLRREGSRSLQWSNDERVHAAANFLSEVGERTQRNRAEAQPESGCAFAAMRAALSSMLLGPGFEGYEQSISSPFAGA